MKSKRIGFVGGIACANFLLLLLAGSCGDTSQTLGPYESGQQPATDMQAKLSESKTIMEAIIIVVVPETGEVREIFDPWIADAILSMLPDATQARLEVKGYVYINDVEIASAIVTMAAIETVDVSNGILMGGASLGCIKKCYSDKPPCDPCPKCCEQVKDKDKGLVPFIEY